MDELFDIIEDNSTPMIYRNIKDAINVLDDLSVVSHLTNIENSLHRFFNNTITNIELVDEVQSTLSNTLYTVSNEFGIKIVDGLSLPELVDVVDPITKLEYIEDYDWFIKILNSDSEDRCKLIALLCNIKTTSLEGFYYEHIESVSTFLFKRLAELISRKNKNIEQTHEVGSHLTLLSRYKAILVEYLSNKNRYKDTTIKDYIVEDLIKLGVPIGLNINQYLFEDILIGEELDSDNYSINSLITSMNPLSTAMNLIGISLICDNEEKTPRELINEIIEELIHDANTLVKVQIEVSELLNRLSKYLEDVK